MKTSCFNLYRGPGRISIARFAPRNMPAGFRACKILVPGGWSKGPGGWSEGPGGWSKGPGGWSEGPGGWSKGPGGWSEGPGGRGWVDEAAFDAGYAAQLAALDPHVVWNFLHELAGGAEPVLLCWEVPPFTPTNRCHRRLVAAWFKQHLGVEVDEWVARTPWTRWAKVP